MCNIRDNNINSITNYHFVKENQENRFLTFLYHNPLGRVFQKVFASRSISKAMGKFYEKKFSTRFIPKFIEQNKIDMTLFKEKEYHSFNDFFTREKKEISFSKKKTDFCAPCDGYLSVYKITRDQTFRIKNLDYDLSDLLRNYALAAKYKDGLAFIFRLAPKHYHRFHYFDDGSFVLRKDISGFYHTVRPVALAKKQVYLENIRGYSMLNMKNFGDVLYMEVGALGVGQILNHLQRKFKRGEEKGMFLFGGSTIIILLEYGTLIYPDELIEKTKEGYEAVVSCGDVIGEIFE